MGVKEAVRQAWRPQTSVDILPTLSGVSLFKGVRADAVQMTVTARGIVERDVVRDLVHRQRPRLVDLLLDAFLLQATGERLDDRIVPAVGLAAHAWFEAVRSAEAAPSITPELRALI